MSLRNVSDPVATRKLRPRLTPEVIFFRNLSLFATGKIAIKITGLMIIKLNRPSVPEQTVTKYTKYPLLFRNLEDPDPQKNSAMVEKNVGFYGNTSRIYGITPTIMHIMILKCGYVS